MIVRVTTSDTSISHKGVLHTLNDEIEVSAKEYDEIKELVRVVDLDMPVTEEVDLDMPVTEEVEEEMSYAELRDAAKAKGIKGFHKMSADELREALEV